MFNCNQGSHLRQVGWGKQGDNKFLCTEIKCLHLEIEWGFSDWI